MEIIYQVLEYDITAAGRQTFPDRDISTLASVTHIALTSPNPEIAVFGEIGVSLGNDEVLPEAYGADMFINTSAGHDEKYAEVNGSGFAIGISNRKVKTVWTDKQDPALFAPYKIKIYLKGSKA